MKGGHTPIHLQRWAPADYQSDEHVQLLLRRRAWGTLTFYRQFMDASFLAGGDLPRCAEGLAAVLRMPRGVVTAAMTFCLGHEFACAPTGGCRHGACQVGGGLADTCLTPASGLPRGRVGGCLHPACQSTCLGHDADCLTPRLLQSDGGRIFQKRVRRDVAKEMEVRAIQSELGREGGKAAGRGRPKVTPIDKDRVDPIGAIGPPSPSPAPRTTDPPSPLLAQGGDGPHPDRGQPDQAERLRLYWIAIGGRPDRNDRRHLREALFAGHPEQELREQISERVRDDLIRAGRFDESKPWPPEMAAGT